MVPQLHRKKKKGKFPDAQLQWDTNIGKKHKAELPFPWTEDEFWHVIGAQIFQNLFWILIALASVPPEFQFYYPPFYVSPIFKTLTYKKETHQIKREEVLSKYRNQKGL